MRPMTLRNSLVLIVVAALVPIGTLSVVQALSDLRNSRVLIANQLVANALATAGQQREPLLVGKQALLTLSQSPRVRAGGAECKDALKSGLGNSPALLNFARSDSAGRVQCSAMPFASALSFTTQDWWHRGIKAGGFTLSAPVFGQISKQRVLIGMHPIAGSDGNNDGAVTVAIDASWLERALASSEMTVDAAVMIIDGTGRVVLDTENRALPRFDPKAADGRIAEAKGADGVAWTYAVAPLYERELYVVYAEPTEQLMATALRQVRIGLVLPILGLLLASVAIWFGTRYFILRWLESLRLLADRFARGNFTGDPIGFARAPHEIALLSNDLQSMAHTIEARDNALRTLLDAKTALTHDIHHRVKNNLQIVSSLLDMQASKIDDPAARTALGQTRARIGALAQIHRLLYEESDDSDHGLVNIANLLTALCAQLRALHRGQSVVRLVCDAASQTVPVNSTVPLTLLAVEAVTNAYRHGFPDGRSGTIILHFDVAEGRATLSVTDDGIGFDLAQDPAAMGRQLMDAFAFQLGGVLEISSTPGTGTVTQLTYPLHHEHDRAVSSPDE